MIDSVECTGSITVINVADYLLSRLSLEVLDSLLVIMWHKFVVVEEEATGKRWLVGHFRNLFKLVSPHLGPTTVTCILDTYALTVLRFSEFATIMHPAV